MHDAHEVGIAEANAHLRGRGDGARIELEANHRHRASTKSLTPAPLSGHAPRVAQSKKRLPVLKSTPEEEQGEEPRPPWQWVGFGVAATFGAWVPLQYLAEAATQRLLAAWVQRASTAEDVATAIASLSSSERARVWAVVLGFRVVPAIASSFFGGYVVGRWGGDNAGPRESAIAGAATALIVSVLALAAFGGVVWWTPALVLVLTTPPAWMGGRVGVRRRKRAMTPNMM
jgi:hypothetical protein